MSEQNPYATPYEGGDGPGEGKGYTWGPGTPGYGYPQQPQPGYGYPQDAPPPGFAAPGAYPAPVAGGAATPLVTIGDVVVTQDGILTPVGTLPLRGAVWTVTDLSRTEEKMAQTGIVLGIIFGVLLCGLGLLFLLMKEKKTTGFVQVTVSSGGRHHVTMVPANGPETFQIVMGQVNYARGLSV
ncbi:hypothetical protein AB0J21_28530 [Streptomyces sp. NPDC049954]|uniref:hypothetical protein n=1 Tax=Streptomyces sp. NPDC049954 TaxID=3155779 RepID=UPI003422D671